MDTYSEAHLFVAAIRILNHHKGAAPSLEEVSDMLKVSDESAHATCRNLKKFGIIDTMEDPFTIKVVIADHLKIEELPRELSEEDNLAKEIERFQAKKKNFDEKVSSIQAEIEKKKKGLFSDLEAKFKEEMEKHKNNQ